MLRFIVTHQRVCAVLMGVGLAGAGAVLLDAAEPPLSRFSFDRREARDEAGPAADEEPTARVNFFNSKWADILQEVAEKTESTLVMDEVPPGRWTWTNRTRYSRTEIVRILNRELEPKGYRVLEQGEYLIVLNLTRANPEYRRPELTATENSTPPTQPAVAPEVPTYQRRFDSIPTRSERAPRSAANPAITQVAGEMTEEPPALAATHEASAETTLAVVRPRHLAARDLATLVYKSLKERADLVNEGPRGLPAFRVFRGDGAGDVLASADREVLFAVGIDVERNELVVEAPAEQARTVTRLLTQLDEPPSRSGQGSRLIDAPDNVALAAMQAQEELEREQPRPPIAQPEDPFAQPDPRELPLNIRGNVEIEVVPGIGVIIKGNQQDVEAVEDLIRRIQEAARGTTANIHVQFLRNVNSEALAALLNTVYERLTQIRARGTTQTAPVAVVPLVKPNAVLILASEDEMPAVRELVEKLDQPVDPSTEFEVFPLKNAIATQVVAQITSLYPAPADAATAGLRTRVLAIADVRTNSVIVRASPGDLEEIGTLVRNIDRQEIGSVNQVRVFTLRNAVATELANTINTVIQGVISGPATPVQTQGAAVATPGTGAQELRDAKSIVLEFLTAEGPDGRILRTGVLADIRVTADPQRNNLIVTAPAQTMEFLAALIEQLDQPADTVAEIKVFTLENSDATSMVTLLQTLFAPQTTTGQPGQPGGPGGQLAQTLGIPVAGTETAGSSLIPLRFSVDARTNSVIAIGGADALRIVEAILLRLDQSDVRERQTIVIKLKNAPVTEVANAINAFLQTQRELLLLDPNLVSSTELLQREIIAVPEPVSNSLLISATPRYFDEIKRIVAQLDAAPPQVVIQALIVEVTLDNTDEFGVELGFQDPLLFARSVIAPEDITTISQTSTSPNGVQTTTQQIISQQAQPGFLFNNQPLGNNITQNPSSVGTQGLSNFSLGRVNPDLGFGGLVLSASSESVSVLIRALAARRQVHVLSRPQIRTLDNQYAEVQVGQSVPIVTGVTTANLVTSPQTQPRDVGIILAVTPRITPDGNIVMEVIAERSSLAGQGVPIFTDVNTGNVIESPIINISEARAVVSVPNGQTVVLGGMITKSEETLERKIPYLGDIPVLGMAFRYDGTTTQRTELLIFLTPRVVYNDIDSELIKEVESERLHFVVQEAEAIHGPIFATPPADAGFPPPLSGPGGVPCDEYGIPLDPSTVPNGYDYGPQMPVPPAPGATRPDDTGVPTTVVPQGYRTTQSAGGRGRRMSAQQANREPHEETKKPWYKPF